MTPAPGRVCCVCVMCDSEPGVEIGADGQCNCCRDALQRKAVEWWPGPEGEQRLAALVQQLRADGRGKPYDAMVGLSGGIDSGYLAHRMAQLGLRLLAVHVDAGWNSEPAVNNIEKLVRALNLDLYTYVVEWSEVRDVQLAFLRAGVLNQDFPQDHAFFAILIRAARRFGIRNFLSGVNFASENLHVPRGSPSSTDGSHVRAVHAAFGTGKLQSYPVMTMSEYLWMTKVRGTPRRFRPLDFMDYNKARARDELVSAYGWRDYGAKHSESRFTKFYQDIYLPRKFAIDKRRLHLSSLIVSGQITRDEALQQLQERPVSALAAAREIRFVAKKLGMSEVELERLIDSPPRPHADFASAQGATSSMLKVRHAVRTLRRHLASS
jgi:N-acetyl sugar amidotransferase